MIEKLVSGIRLPKGGKRKFNDKYYLLKSVHRTKKGAQDEKTDWKGKNHLVRIWNGSGKFPYHVFVR